MNGKMGKIYLPCIPLNDGVSRGAQVTYWAVITAIKVIKAIKNNPGFNNLLLL
jgi:hypothetical protein